MRKRTSDPAPPVPVRYLSSEDRNSFTPVHVVWEITLACDLKCQHCGSRAGRVRPRELTTDECLDLVRQFARLGTREVTLIGGEAYLRRDWLQIIREISSNGMLCTLQSGGLNLTAERLRQAAEAGLRAAGVSIDGLRDLHDRLRGVPGSFDRAFAALKSARKYGLATSVNTQITSQVIPELPALMDLFIAAGAKNWQVQLTVAMGRAADHPELLLQPYELLDLMPVLAGLYKDGVDRGFLLQPGNNIGYFGPYESLWRGAGDESIHWTSCNAGQNTVGIEADGAIKGCPSLPTASYTGGNIRELSAEQIWNNTPELAFTRTRTIDDLWGYCRSCYYAEVCRAGCTWTTHTLFGRPGNNPYCHHRVLDLAAQGLRERIVRVEAPPGLPFDHGKFELVLESAKGSGLEDEAEPAHSTPLTGAATNMVTLTSALNRRKKRGKRIEDTDELELCRACNRHVRRGTVTCPHCGGDMRSHELAYQRELLKARRAEARLLQLM
jgi:Y-X(10)_GDL-associated radical SAM protein